MNQYHKIQTLFLRDPETNHKTLLHGQYALPEFEYLKDNQWVFTEKIDGTNIRVMSKGDDITFGGKTDNAQIPAKLTKRLEELFLPQWQWFGDMFHGGICLYGEGYGSGIQSGGDYLSHQDFILFDVLVNTQQGPLWLKREDVHDVAQELGINVVPVVGTGTLADMVRMVRDGFPSWISVRAMAEGIVARPVVELRDRRGERIITKLKYKDFPR